MTILHAAMLLGIGFAIGILIRKVQERRPIKSFLREIGEDDRPSELCDGVTYAREKS